MPPTAFKSRRVVTSEGIRPATLIVQNGRIQTITDYNYPTPAEDFQNQVLLPGLVDTHVHLNEPGRTHWEGFSTGTRAAAAGGITTLVDMPLNCLPETTSVAALEAKRHAAAGNTYIDWLAWGGVVADNQHHIEPLAAAGVPGFKCFLVYPGIEGFTMINHQQLREAMPHIARTGLPLLVHAELSGPLESAAKDLTQADWHQYSTWLASRPDEAELQAIELLISLAEEFRTPIHIVHLATARALPILKAARDRGLPITVETCPHYLTFAAETIPPGATEFKCAPPIRSLANQAALWQGLRDGIIDLIATDHSPCPPEMKGPRFSDVGLHNRELGDFSQSWGGVASLSVALPVIHTAMLERNFSPTEALTRIARWMSAAPAKLAGLAAIKGAIAPNHHADFTVFAPETAFTPTAADLHFRHPISPYLGQHLTGKVTATYLRGQCIYRDGQFITPPIGKELRS